MACRSLRGPAVSPWCGRGGHGHVGWGPPSPSKGAGIAQADCCRLTVVASSESGAECSVPLGSTETLSAHRVLHTLGPTDLRQRRSLGLLEQSSGEASRTLLSLRDWAVGRTVEHGGTCLQ